MDAAKLLLITGFARTFTESLAVLPVPPLVDVTLLVVLFWVPNAAPVTVTWKVQGEPTEMVAPPRLITPVPAVVVRVPVPQTLFVEESITVKPEGKVSVKATPARSTVLAAGFVKVKVRLVVPLTGMLAAPKTLAIVGGATTLVEAEAVRPVPPSIEVTAPVVLFF